MPALRPSGGQDRRVIGFMVTISAVHEIIYHIVLPSSSVIAQARRTWFRSRPKIQTVRFRKARELSVFADINWHGVSPDRKILEPQWSIECSDMQRDYRPRVVK
jgi:hypothetical protein